VASPILIGSHGSGSTTTTVVGPTDVDSGVDLASGEAGCIELHVMSDNGGSSGTSYHRLRSLFHTGGIGGGVNVKVVHAAAGIAATYVVSSGKVRLRLTGLASSVNWAWWWNTEIRDGG